MPLILSVQHCSTAIYLFSLEIYYHIVVYIKRHRPVFSPIVRTLANVLIVNSRSIVRKIDELEYYSNEYKIDIIIVTETWLSDNIPSEAVNISGYTLIRKDRVNGLGGGCAI